MHTKRSKEDIQCFTVPLPFILLIQGPLLTLTLGVLLGLALAALPVSDMGLQIHVAMPGFLYGCSGFKFTSLDSHACGLLSSEPPPQAICIF